MNQPRKFHELRSALHMPMKSAIRTVFEAVVESFLKLIQPTSGILLVKTKYETVPICDLDSAFSLIYPRLLFLQTDLRIGVVECSVIFAILVGGLGAEEVAIGRELL